MAAAAAEPCRCHIVAVPFPGRGHVNAMMNLSRLLAARGAAVTFVVTEEWLGLLRSSSSAPPPPGVRLHAIPNVIPSEHGRAADHAGFLDAVATEMEAPFELLLDRLREEEGGEVPPVAALVADTYVSWVVGVGNRRGVPVCSLFPMPASFFSAYYHFESLPPRLVDEHAPAAGATTDKSDKRLEHYISGFASSSVTLSDLEPLIHNKKTVNHVLAAVSSIKNAQCLLFTTMYELEAGVINSLRSALPCPVLPVGPCIPYMTLEDQHSKSNGEVTTSPGDCFTWLDSQPVNSVLYVSLGSFLSVSASQLDEIALGLASSGVRFLWILREKSSRVRELVGDTDRGMIMAWCDQLKVLCHPSVGGFLTHCGMNSTLEAVFAGVPMLALPLFFDQPIDGRLIVEDWKVGLALREWADKDGLIGSQDIARAVKRLMACDEDNTKAIRRRALEWKEVCGRAVEKGGSSYDNLSSLMQMVCASRCTELDQQCSKTDA
ncbi:UDP-glycosyltransferase 87A2-like [Triticum dicoccoides]|nr:UDP-glycosyltransferase 87A2-like [Triticum dicoccoides]